MQKIKCVLVGDDAVGKSTLLSSYYKISYPGSDRQYRDAWTTDYLVDMTVDGNEITLGVQNTVWNKNYDRLRPLLYPQTDVFLICFSLESATSFENVGNKWYPELRYYCPKTPIILVGNKIDLREKSTLEESEAKNLAPVITNSQGVSMAKKIGAVKYLECSSNTPADVKTVFDEAIQTALARKSKSNCAIM